jgi:hypothetical protein
MLGVGLHLVGESIQQQNVKLTLRLQRFKACFGSHTLVYAKIWHDLRPFDERRNLAHFLIFVFWLKCYDVEHDMALRFDLHEETVRRNCLYYLVTVRKLKASKVSK